MNAYLHGPGATPLLGETIGDNLRRTVERFGDRDALVVRSQNYRATYRQLWDSTTVLARALLASGVQTGRPCRHLVTESVRVGPDAIRRRAHRRHPRQHQPRVQGCGTPVCARAVRHLPADPRQGIPDERLCAGGRGGAALLPRIAGDHRRSTPTGCPCSNARTPRRTSSSRNANRSCSSTIPSTSSTRPARRASPKARRSRITTS